MECVTWISTEGKDCDLCNDIWDQIYIGETNQNPQAIFEYVYKRAEEHGGGQNGVRLAIMDMERKQREMDKMFWEYVRRNK